jgi:hypothetical protein
MEQLSQYLPLIIPILIINIILWIITLRDLSQREKVRGPKWMWVLIILFVQIFGPIIYLLVARQEE